MHVTYLSLSRLPSEKANGFQICKMCESFSACGAKVTLIHPRRKQTPQLAGKSVFEYYGIPPTFGVSDKPYPDIFRIEPYLPKSLFSALFIAASFLWGLYAAAYVTPRDATAYTRDLPVAFWLAVFKREFLLELHSVPAGVQRFYLRALCILQKRCIKIVALTSFVRDRLVDFGFESGRIMVSPDAVDLKAYASLPTRADAKRSLGIDAESLVIGYVGRFNTMEHEKGVANLIRACAFIKKNSPAVRFRLLCVGGPAEMIPEYESLAESEGVRSQVQLLDRIPNAEVPRHIAACDIATMPFPWSEHIAYYASPLKMFEYMAAGSAIVTTDLPSIREILKDGESAIFAKSDSPQDLARALESALANTELRQKISNNARAQAAEFDWKARAKKILDSAFGVNR